MNIESTGSAPGRRRSPAGPPPGDGARGRTGAGSARADPAGRGRRVAGRGNAGARHSAASARAARRWQRPALALAASLAVAAVALGVFQSGIADGQRRSSPRSTRRQRARGSRRRIPAGSRSRRASRWRSGQQLVTGPRGKAALTLARGVTLRLDANTRIALAGIDRVVVERGAVYLDAGDRPAAGPSLRIDSAFGSTRHLGTQYEVRVPPAEMQVSVREGRVELAARTRSGGSARRGTGRRATRDRDHRHRSPTRPSTGGIPAGTGLPTSPRPTPSRTGASPSSWPGSAGKPAGNWPSPRRRSKRPPSRSSCAARSRACPPTTRWPP